MNILFTCAGRRTYLLKYFRENMSAGDKIIAVDMQLSAPALQVADVKLQVPAIYAPDYLEKVLSICKEYRVDAIISLNDLELPILAEGKTSFDEIGVRVIVSDLNVIDICFDKYKTAKWIESLGLNTPKTYINLSEAKEEIKNGNVGFPLILKPRWGSGSIEVETVTDMEELDIYYALLLKRIKKTILATASIGEEYIVIQENLTGNEYGLDVMNDLDGNYVAVSVKQKLAMRSGETDKAVTVDDVVLREIGKKVGESLGHVANLDMDIMQRSNGDYCVLELNPRFGGGFPFSYEAGVNFPKAILDWLRGNVVDSSMLQPEYGKMFAKNDFLLEIRE